MIEFKEFPKIPRFNREIVITEKLDGTNAAVVIEQHPGPGRLMIFDENLLADEDCLSMYAQSRSQFINPERDNFGFAKWVKDNATELFKLGPGVHYGEWWGKGVNKRYPTMAGKKFSLFNVARWGGEAIRPACCDVVPQIYKGPLIQAAIDAAVTSLRDYGSIACPGAKAEGIIVFHTAANMPFKITCEKDETFKGNAS